MMINWLSWSQSFLVSLIQSDLSFTFYTRTSPQATHVTYSSDSFSQHSPILPTLQPKKETTRKRRNNEDQSAAARRSQSTPLTDKNMATISTAAAKGIEGTSSVSVHDMVSRRFPIPGFVKKIGTHAMTFYFDERRKMMNAHNELIYQAVVSDTEKLKRNTVGRGIVKCPECQDNVAWGNLLSHRLEKCRV